MFLVVDGAEFDVGPLGLGLLLLQLGPVAVRLQPPLQHELRLVLLGRNQADDVFVQALRGRVFVNLGDEAPLVFAVGKGL